jgi:RHS repeat-associated protein
VKTTIGYGPQTTGVGNNLLPVSVSRGDGTGTLTATTAYTYDDVGNLTYVDGPLSGTADTTRTLYNADREQLGTIGPDPDGAGSLKNRAVRNTIDSKGLTTKVEYGTTTGQSDTNWAAFSPAQAVDITYDTRRRVATRKLSAGGTDYALTQTDYYADDSVQCVAQRMNTAVYGSLPASACTPASSAGFGPDRIAKSSYDPVGNRTQLQVGFATADVASERTLTYSNNDMLATLKDAENNLTTYEYDGFDRLSKTRYPVTAKGGNASSTTDYEQPGYDDNSNVISFRNRAAQSIGFTYDNLNRKTLKDLPGSEPDVTYAYDNLGRPTSASQTGNALSFTWDALSRRLTEVGPQGTATSDWDLAGRRTQLTYPGSGLYVNYDYLVTGEVTKVRENGASSGVGVLATYSYDDLGNRTSLTFGNGVAQAFTFDPVSRLASLTNDLSGTTNDLTVSPIAYSPASQIASTVRTGDAYAWTGHGNGSTPFTQNGLNQQITIGGSAATWDTKGNLTSEPQSAKTYGYSSENLLTSATGGVTLGYDPGLRLYQVAGGTTTRFAYDGLNAIAEYNGSNALQRRYVFGPRTDEALVQYEGTGTADRRFMSADERGSIISLTDSSGALLNINRYDEYGKPQSTNVGRFQYTGQMWLSELGAYYYKARVYLPHLGIFAQTDPIGYTGTLNLYAYVFDDPVNLNDPSGLLPPVCNPAQGPCGDVPVTGSRPNAGVDLDTLSIAPRSTDMAFNNALSLVMREMVVDADAIVISAYRTKRLGKFKLRMNSGREQFYRIDASGSIKEVPLRQEEVDCGGGLFIMKNRLPANSFSSNDILDVHTHGFSGPLSGIPGPGDAGIPLSFGITLYGITNYGAWSISPNSGGGVNVKLLIGGWGPGAEHFDPSAYGRGGNAGTSSGNSDLCAKAGL